MGWKPIRFRVPIAIPTIDASGDCRAVTVPSGVVHGDGDAISEDDVT
jgi:hypothetical protein